MKSVALTLAAAAVLSAAVLSGCASRTPAPAPAPTPVAVAPVALPAAPRPPATQPAPPPANPPVSQAASPAPAVAPQTPVAQAAPGNTPAPAVASKPLAAEPGLYRCEDKQSATLKRVIDGGRSIVLNFRGTDYTLQRVPSETGALRFEDKASGYTWIMVVDFSFLLNAKSGQRVANKCVL